MTYASGENVIKLFRPLAQKELKETKELIPAVEASIRLGANNVGKGLGELLKGENYLKAFKSIVMDIVGRTFMTSTDREPMTREGQSTLRYSWSGTYLVPGGGLLTRRTELTELGLRKQRYGVVDFYETPERYPCNFDPED